MNGSKKKFIEPKILPPRTRPRYPVTPRPGSAVRVETDRTVGKKPGPVKVRPRQFLIYFLPLLIYAGLVFYLSMVPLGDAPPGEKPAPEHKNMETGGGPGADEPAKSILYLYYNIPSFNELANIVLFMVFGFLLYRLLRFYLPLYTRSQSQEVFKDIRIQIRIAFIVIVIAFCYSAVIEVSQMFEVSRVSDVFDILFNTLGAFLGSIIYAVIDRKTTKLNIN